MKNYILKRGSFLRVVILCFLCFYISTALSSEDTVLPVAFEPDDLVFWAFSDIQPRNGAEKKYFEIAADDIAGMKNIDAALCAGDIVQQGSEKRAIESYNWFYNTYRKTGIRNLYEIAGNHDSLNVNAYLEATGKPLHYALRYGNLLLILLSDEKYSSGSDISDGAFFWWRDLVETNRDKSIITVTHSHLNGSGFIYNIISHRNVTDSDRFTEVLKKEKVELWLCGHEHIPSFLGLSKRQIESLGGTVFMNISAIREDHCFSDAESRIIILKKGSDEMTVRIRNHRQGKFKDLLEQKIKLKVKFDYDGKEPVMIKYDGEIPLYHGTVSGESSSLDE